MRPPYEIYGKTNPSLSQIHFRFRNDDGSETTATWNAAKDTNITLGLDTNIRLRFEIQEVAGAATTKAWRLRYSKNGGAYTDVTSTSLVARASASPNFTEDTDCTDQMPDGLNTFVGTQGMDEADGRTGTANMAMAAAGQAECEFCFQLRSADLVNNDTVDFRIYDVSGVALNTYNVTPRITVSATSNQTITPAGKTSASSFGSITIVPGGTVVSVSGKTSASAFGTPTVKSNYNVAISGISSASAFGTATAIAGNVNVSATGLASEASFGAVTIVPGAVTQAVSGLASEASFGTPTVSASGGAQNVAISGLATEANFGAVSIQTAITKAVSGLATEAGFGTVALVPGGITATVSGLNSAASFYTPTINTAITVTVAGLASQAQLGVATMFPGGVGEFVGGLASEASFGYPNVSTPGGGGGDDWCHCDDAFIHLHS